VLNRIAIDNYKCFVNFELKLDRLQLFMGANGTGKSTVGQLLLALRDMAVNKTNVEQHFRGSRNRWLKTSTQLAELEVTLKGQVYSYRISIEHREASVRVGSEYLATNGKEVFSNREGDLEAQPLLDIVGPKHLTYGTNTSAVSVLSGSSEKVQVFFEWLKNLRYHQIFPTVTLDQNQSERRLNPDSSNAISWLRWLLQTQPGDYIELRDRLRDCFDGFLDLANREFPEGERLAVEMEFAGKSAAVPFAELSDGQRVLILLHAILVFARRSPGLLILDEPENFVGLREIEPWISLLEEAAEEGPAQIVVLSHHPEYLNRLMDKAILFKRQSNGWPKAERLNREALPSLPLAELVARGWEDA